MAKFIKVEHVSVSRVFVIKVSSIVGFYELGPNETKIDTLNGGTYIVKGSPDDILKMIDE